MATIVCIYALSTQRSSIVLYPRRCVLPRQRALCTCLKPYIWVTVRHHQPPSHAPIMPPLSPREAKRRSHRFPFRNQLMHFCLNIICCASSKQNRLPVPPTVLWAFVVCICECSSSIVATVRASGENVSKKKVAVRNCADVRRISHRSRATTYLTSRSALPL
jgi:hypothetical protein